MAEQPQPYEHILTETLGPVALLRLNRPQALNALNTALMNEVADALEAFDADDAVRAIVLTGNERAFAAGADIKEMANASPIDMLQRMRFQQWDRMRAIRKPLIAAVSGFCLGGGNELAMCCDLIVAGENARFGQPEINIGVIPGAGGTQRLARALGKARAMEIVLTGRPITAQEAFAAGLITKVVPTEACLDEALALAAEIATKPPLAVQLGKDAVLHAFDLSLQEGLAYERKNFYLLFASEDMREGMAAFVEKRRAEFRGR
ncbi:MAG TPA: enoyl-CoA hydratase-related protein [Thermomicrobiales bacterium]|nr:enoyl-CoA hydratase-related protein [Thermomicrobiales bacterium]